MPIAVADPKPIVDALAADGIIVDYRPGVVRCSPAFYNTEARSGSWWTASRPTCRRRTARQLILAGAAKPATGSPERLHAPVTDGLPPDHPSTGEYAIALRAGNPLLTAAATRQVPDSHDSLYAFCSGVIGSIRMPMVSSLRRAMSRSMSSGMP